MILVNYLHDSARCYRHQTQLFYAAFVICALFLSVPVVVWLDAISGQWGAIAYIAKRCNGSLERSDANELVYRFANAIQGLEFQWEVNRLGLVEHAQLYYPYEIVEGHRVQVESVGG